MVITVLETHQIQNSNNAANIKGNLSINKTLKPLFIGGFARLREWLYNTLVVPNMVPNFVILDRLLILSYIFCGLQFADLITTIIGVGFLGLSETNPFFTDFMAVVNDAFIGKLMLCVLMALFIISYLNFNRKTPLNYLFVKSFINFINIFMLVGVLNNLYIIFFEIF